ncbi:MAG: 30S ribosomal protein S12 methylthiotransferase RimO [Gemmatimonadales bacterium]|jgi:ribosomal protein S12 methylthiotransferase|nr:30S ribosomal protein S12 methylthiotransferase RimO [Gemmatimonadales bacterium]MDG2240196.1 30S ribosomal protein S12 methylthiotransferase RimO [Longimicrobiales bacterium]MBT3499457.1 30S ribosomal protein S12 methylthiotransferase RimO [Gemmatimonadales bacterium]MBT3775842.1 30S ribosomal protein S12 methylthiotransferase RimO [Gemmatimonadales bacterium]MBT3959061.1 30S ribosomal protein S12 methylthiotransferase RimO [Gemmatimonadales bacterium]
MSQARTRDLPVFPLTPDPVRGDASRDAAPVHHQIEATGAEDGPRIALITLGCDKNTVDSERMMAALVGHGAHVSSEVDGADVVIVNTCGFIQEAKEQSIETILEACDLKADGGLKAVVAVGCLVQRYKDDLVEEIPEVDLFMGLTELQGLVPELRQRGLLPDEEVIPTMERPLRVLSTATSHTSYLKISEGCDHTCAFCAIPLMRGLHRSQPVDLLVREAAGLGEMGVKEINIISQDTTWFGRDLKRKDQSAPLLRELLQGLIEGTDVPWYRLFYMYPSGITREMVDFMASEARILPYLDMPIQHGSDRVLGLMRRPERQATIRERVGWLREAIPDLTLRTTVIVGFPGETDADFREMLELLDEIQFERVGAFTYSVEEGTRAADMDGQIDQQVMNERLEELMELQRGISFDKNAALIGQTMTALVDRVIHDDPEFGAVARTVGQALDVDGVTNIRKADALAVGSLIDVEIVDALDYDLVAELK